MAELTLIVGGSGSGKSRYAEQRVFQEVNPGEGRVVYLATGVVTDQEFASRVEKHRQRRPRDWITVEESLELSRAVAELPSNTRVLLVDGIGTWMANFILQEAEREDPEAFFNSRLHDFLAACRPWQGKVFLVADEVGMGLVPESKAGRLFRDLNGWANQELAREASEVVQVVCGLPVPVKG